MALREDLTERTKSRLPETIGGLAGSGIQLTQILKVPVDLLSDLLSCVYFMHFFFF